MNRLNLSRLYSRLHYQFQDESLLQAALTHRSFGSAHNERLEFLGDSVLNFIMAHELFQRFPKAMEGELTRMRARLVCGEEVAHIARELGLGDYLQLGAGELKTGGHDRSSILSDAAEALLGAIYLDGGFAACQRCVLAWYEGRLARLQPKVCLKDAKTRLQEYLQSRKLPLPQYQVIEVQGKAHAQGFCVQCTVSFLPEPVLGLGSSRRLAEQAAAEKVLTLIEPA